MVLARAALAQLLTRGEAGNAQWLASIQKSKGMRSGHHSTCNPPMVSPKPKKKGGGKKGKAVVDDEEAEEMETFVQPKPKKKGKARG